MRRLLRTGGCNNCRGWLLYTVSCAHKTNTSTVPLKSIAALELLLLEYFNLIVTRLFIPHLKAEKILNKSSGDQVVWTFRLRYENRLNTITFDCFGNRAGETQNGRFWSVSIRNRKKREFSNIESKSISIYLVFKEYGEHLKMPPKCDIEMENSHFSSCLHWNNWKRYFPD